jgi:hypothetical protein
MGEVWDIFVFGGRPMGQVQLAFKARYRVQELFLNTGAMFVLRHELPGTSVLLSQLPDGPTMEVIQKIDVSEKRVAMLRLLEKGQLPEGSTPDPKDSRVAAGEERGTFYFMSRQVECPL